MHYVIRLYWTSDLVRESRMTPMSSLTLEEVWALFREVAEAQKETARKLQETARQIERVFPTLEEAHPHSG